MSANGHQHRGRNRDQICQRSYENKILAKTYIQLTISPHVPFITKIANITLTSLPCAADDGERRRRQRGSDWIRSERLKAATPMHLNEIDSGGGGVWDCVNEIVSVLGLGSCLLEREEEKPRIWDFAFQVNPIGFQFRFGSEKPIWF